MRCIFRLGLAIALAAGCTTRSERLDSGRADAGTRDAAESDAGRDAGSADAAVDAARVDAARVDASGVDAGRSDAGRVDAGAPDAARDSGSIDAAACVLGTVMCTGGYTPERYAGACGARELHVIGVYEPTTGSTMIPVSVTRTGAALTIVVSAYDPVRWAFTLGPGVNVEQVILNGFGSQTTSGLPPSVPIVDRSGAGGYFAACAYEWPVGTGGCETELLIAGVEGLTMLRTTSFTGCYQASTFSIADP